MIIRNGMIYVGIYLMRRDDKERSEKNAQI